MKIKEPESAFLKYLLLFQENQTVCSYIFAHTGPHLNGIMQYTYTDPEWLKEMTGNLQGAGTDSFKMKETT